MAKNEGQIVIKKYANRRLYNTGTSTYVWVLGWCRQVSWSQGWYLCG